MIHPKLVASLACSGLFLTVLVELIKLNLAFLRFICLYYITISLVHIIIFSGFFGSIHMSSHKSDTVLIRSCDLRLPPSSDLATSNGGYDVGSQMLYDLGSDHSRCLNMAKKHGFRRQIGELLWFFFAMIDYFRRHELWGIQVVAFKIF